ncbi:MAG: type II toxin-antitoxin system RelE/ParE family toxin [Ruminococcus sp.]|nr:type II toxin-antitoxin system RelE/ParE family toxin [Ruminococcus sp.]
MQFKKSAIKALKQMDKPTKERIKKAIIGLTLSPSVGDIKSMQGYKDSRFRLRVGQYCIIYKYNIDGTVEILLILGIGARGDIYK